MNVIEVGQPLFDAKFIEALSKELQGKLSQKTPSATGPYIDYEVAQIYAWTLKILNDESKAMGVPMSGGDKISETFGKLHDSTKKEMTPTLLIDLRDKWIEKDKIIPIADRLAPRMNSIKNFDSLGFRKMFD
jgi:carbamoylphosphate synthase large subunit